MVKQKNSGWQVTAFIFIFITIFLIGGLIINGSEMERMKKGFGEFMVFQAELTGTCLEANNMTIENLTEMHIDKEVEKIKLENKIGSQS